MGQPPLCQNHEDCADKSCAGPCGPEFANYPPFSRLFAPTALNNNTKMKNYAANKRLQAIGAKARLQPEPWRSQERMKKLRFILACVVLGTGLAVIAGYFINSCKASNYYSLPAKVVEVHTQEIGFHDRDRFGPPIPVYETFLVLQYRVNGTSYTGHIRTSEAGFSVGATVSIICNKKDPLFISLNE